MLIRCIIIEDEPLAKKGLSEYCNKIDFLNLISTYSNISEANEILENGNIDLIFLDINLPHITGIEFVRNVSPIQLIIFTTAHAEYAIEGFELNIMDYLLKPISFERFKKSVDHAKEYLEYLEYKTDKKENSIFIQINGRIQKIKYDDILFIEACSNYVKIITEKNTFLHYNSMYKFYEKLNKKLFIKVHRSYIINKSKINTLWKDKVQISNHIIPITQKITLE